MTLLDVPDVFIGSTDDGHTFVVLNRRIRDAAKVLTDAGFRAHEHPGRTLYLLPPGTCQDAHERAGDAMHGLLAHTYDLVELAWTTRWSPDASDSGTVPDLRFQVTDDSVTATALTAPAHSILEQHGFLAADASSYRLAPGLGQRGLLSALTAAEAHACAHGLTVHISLGIPTPADISAAPRRTPPTVPGPPSERAARKRR
ncbi:hypothetical protein [Streptomyces sp. NPDC058861]|uniref:hypothetical protein n=1 Tax=Streptomyces sp. NPDC058861 TaxID=3346653 RepID=UPI0036AEC45B